MDIQLVGNFWGYLIYWFAGDVIDLFTFAPHVNSGLRDYFGGAIDSPIFAVFVIVGTFIDLRIFAVVVLMILLLTPARILNTFILRIMRILDRMPLIP